MHIKIEVQNSKKLYLNELLENSNIVLQVLIPPTRDPELEARIQKLKLEQDNKAYGQMTKHIHKSCLSFIYERLFCIILSR